jgi:hypothetical protein
VRRDSKPPNHHKRISSTLQHLLTFDFQSGKYLVIDTLRAREEARQIGLGDRSFSADFIRSHYLAGKICYLLFHDLSDAALLMNWQTLLPESSRECVVR